MEIVVPTIHAVCPPLAPPCAAEGTWADGGAPPILSAATPPRPPPRFRPIYLVLLLVLLLPCLCAIGIASYFHLSSSTQALRGAVMESVPGEWHKRFAVNVGYLTLGLARFGSSFVRLPAEPKAALQALYGAEVGVYQLEEPVSHPDYAAMMKSADKSMRRRGWERIVGVAEGGQFVAVYAPSKVGLKDVSCCVAVLSDQELVIVSARGNITPLLELARRHLHDDRPFMGNF
jgi:hypothetical protein